MALGSMASLCGVGHGCWQEKHRLGAGLAWLFLGQHHVGLGAGPRARGGGVPRGQSWPDALLVPSTPVCLCPPHSRQVGSGSRQCWAGGDPRPVPRKRSPRCTRMGMGLDLVPGLAGRQSPLLSVLGPLLVTAHPVSASTPVSQLRAPAEMPDGWRQPLRGR